MRKVTHPTTSSYCAALHMFYVLVACAMFRDPSEGSLSFNTQASNGTLCTIAAAEMTICCNERKRESAEALKQILVFGRSQRMTIPNVICTYQLPCHLTQM